MHARMHSCSNSIAVRDVVGMTVTGIILCRSICDPYLNLFRGIIPPIGGTLDLSPILAFVTLNVSN